MMHCPECYEEMIWQNDLQIDEKEIFQQSFICCRCKIEVIKYTGADVDEVF